MVLMDISIITSLYRTEPFLADYSERALRLLADCAAEGLAAELLVIANDASAQEQRLLQGLQTTAQNVRVQFVPRETIYASWNRGVQQAQGALVTFWGVDDVRCAGALLEARERAAAGCEVIYFPYDIRYPGWFGGYTIRATPPTYDRDVFRRKMRAGPFWAARRELFETVGLFNPQMRVSGDYDWLVRASEHCDFCRGEQVAGRFDLSHGGNLSKQINPQRDVEDTIIRLQNGLWKATLPVDPALMQAEWERWAAAESPPLTAEQEAFLWGAGAQERYAAWKATYLRETRRKRLRGYLRHKLDQWGLRPLLARLGLVTRG